MNLNVYTLVIAHPHAGEDMAANDQGKTAVKEKSDQSSASAKSIFGGVYSALRSLLYRRVPVFRRCRNRATVLRSGHLWRRKLPPILDPNLYVRTVSTHECSK